MKARKCVVIVKGRALKANADKARVFKTVINARKFVRNLKRVSNGLRWKDVEFITFG